MRLASTSRGAYSDGVEAGELVSDGSSRVGDSVEKPIDTDVLLHVDD